MSKRSRFSPEVRMVFDHQADYESQWGMHSIAAKIGCTTETLRKWVRHSEKDQVIRAGLTADERERLKVLERENREFKRSNEILRQASAYFCPGRARPPTQTMVSFIDARWAQHGVGPIRVQLPDVLRAQGG